MTPRIAAFLSVVIASLLPPNTLLAQGVPPPIPIGYDAIRQWDRWPQLRIGQRTYMTSTYDRRGSNEAADASHFLYQLADDLNVALDLAGPGELVFVRHNHWHGSPWHYLVDGRDHLVQETSSAHPDKPAADSVWMPEAAFPNPLTWTWSTTRGADLSWVVIPFEKWFTLAYERTHYGTGYFIYNKYVSGARLSSDIKSWTPATNPPADVLELLRDCNTRQAGTQTATMPHGNTEVPPNESIWMAELSEGPSMIRGLRLSIPLAGATALGEARMKVWWDDEKLPSIDAPVKLLFATGSFHNRGNREYLVRSFPVHVRFDAKRLNLAMLFPMPYQHRARFQLSETTGTRITDLQWSIQREPYREPAAGVGYFHATFVDHGVPEKGRDLVFLDTKKVEGGGDWCGHFVGTSFIFSDRAVLSTLEGDPRFYFDDSLTPQCQGTGTEEWGGGGDYWGGQTMTLPFAGHPVGARSAKEARAPEDLINSAYRFLLSDLMPFGRNARITFEHGGENQSQEHYQSVTYWYGRRGSFLVKTDSLDVGDVTSEKQHAYESPQASEIQTLSSRFEWGIDHVDGTELYPETTDTGRYTKGTTTFRVSIDPQNWGVMLRRTFDCGFPNQCARVSVSGDPGKGWETAGTWYAAGSNTVVYSNPKGELGATEHRVQTSNRRWRQDEFLLPLSATQAKSSIWVKLEFLPRPIPLFPGQPLPEQAWSEYRYDVNSFVMPSTN